MSTFSYDQHLDELHVSNCVYFHEGNRYVVTTGTGEYSTNLGTACFAYEEADCVRWATTYEDDSPEDSGYQHFSDHCDPVEDRELAVYLAAVHTLRLLTSGACRPILSDEEYELVRHSEGSERTDRHARRKEGVRCSSGQTSSSIGR